MWFKFHLNLSCRLLSPLLLLLRVITLLCNIHYLDILHNFHMSHLTFLIHVCGCTHIYISCEVFWMLLLYNIFRHHHQRNKRRIVSIAYSEHLSSSGDDGNGIFCVMDPVLWTQFSFWGKKLFNNPFFHLFTYAFKEKKWLCKEYWDRCIMLFQRRKSLSFADNVWAVDYWKCNLCKN